MKFNIHRDSLLEALLKVQSVVEKRNTVQILANILCSVKDNVLSLSATDLEVGIRISIPVENSTDGRVTLSAKNFFDIVKELPNKPLTVSKKDNNWVELLCGKSKFTVVSLSADEYPAFPVFEEKTYFAARAEALKQMIDSTSFAVSTDATRYHLNGVYLEHLENNVMRMTATDGHRLSFVDQELFLKMPELKRGIIIPKKGLSEFRKLIDGESDSVSLSFERGYLFVQHNQTYLFIRLIEGEYPDYRQVIPKGADKTAKINRVEFHSALKRVSLLAHEKSRGVKFSFSGSTLTISSSNPDMGEAREELEVAYTSEPIEIGFNAKYVLDNLDVITGDEVEIQLKERLSPAIFSSAGQKNHTYVVMPMRI